MPLYEVEVVDEGVFTIEAPTAEEAKKSVRHSFGPGTSIRSTKRVGVMPRRPTVSRRQNIFGSTDAEERQAQRDIFG